MKAIFLDRDGVINKQNLNGYITNWDEFIFLSGVFEGLRLLDASYKLIVITNQQGIGKGLMTVENLEIIHNKMILELSKTGIVIQKIYFCPHLASDRCSCRKPSTGMLQQALEDYPEIDPDKSYLIGDSLSDMELGARMNIKTIYISHPLKNETVSDAQQQLLKHDLRPLCLKNNLLEAAKFIISADRF